MIDIFFYSIAGKRTNDKINALVEEFLSDSSLPKDIHKQLLHVKECADKGNYPSHQYFDQFYSDSGAHMNSIAEIAVYCKKTLDAYRRQQLQDSIIQAINDTDSSDELLDKLSKIKRDAPTEATLSAKKVNLYSDNNALGQGFNLGVKELDDVTHGIQRGNIASICGFTGHGKSTFANSVVAKNVDKGYKVCILSLELAPYLMWPMFEARFMQSKGIECATSQFTFHTLPADVVEQVSQYEDEFREWTNNLYILDESNISLKMMLNPDMFAKLLGEVAETMGGLDLLVVDHVGQFELLYPTHGNEIIKTIQTVTKTFHDQNGNLPATIICVQANREGEKRATKRQNHAYDIQAISDLNEVERSSSYCVFIYISEDLKMANECVLHLAKHRLGPVPPDTITTGFFPDRLSVGDTVEEVVASDDAFSDVFDGSEGDVFDDF